MDWDKLKSFYMVSIVGSFSVAAEKLNLSQSAVSRQIQSLEDRLHTRLFIRHARGLDLTVQGHILLEATKRMMIEAEIAQNLIIEEEKGVSGLLKIGTTSGFGNLYIHRYLDGFLKKYPDLNLSIIASDQTPNLILGEVDLLIHPQQTNPGIPLIHKRLFRVHLRLFASPSYLEKYGVPQMPEDLDKHKIITYGYRESHPYHNIHWHLNLGKSKGERREPHIEVNSAMTRFDLALKGHGIAMLSLEHPGLKTSGLVEVLADYPGPEFDLYCIYLEQFKKSKRVNVFIDYLQEAVSKDTEIISE